MNTPDERLRAFGTQLITVHDWLRTELSRLREDMDAYLNGEGGRPKDLLAHCMTFCTALSRHHTGEDDHAFPALAEEFPELAPTLEKLREDHYLVSGILAKLETLVAGADPADAARVRSELDGLAAIMESHFSYEERRIVTALNDLTRGYDGTGLDLAALAEPRRST
ncbi:hemerythrin domain-containing protein [Allokutzneria sp. NRRL B-24872]|uniref:hemerythrin domain-containing protein n=1 Tax=Allokutzneria sp. NRRL B-24872 TaxID=1137961 RepID=UPI000A3C706A|nr:hemerythrin domain-containing protein [Allokutzneria sp. NRRL B-24872]